MTASWKLYSAIYRRLGFVYQCAILDRFAFVLNSRLDMISLPVYVKTYI